MARAGSRSDVDRAPSRRQHDHVVDAVYEEGHRILTARISVPPATATAVDEVLSAAVETGAVPHVVAIIADRDGIVYEGSAGDLGGWPPTARTPFQIKSMTKLVTSVLALQLAEQGRLDLDAPVRSLLPEFADLQVLDGFDGDTPRLRPPTTEASEGSSQDPAGLQWSAPGVDIAAGV
jgi:CubicO group peptidase (beta-lactamase class C family)